MSEKVVSAQKFTQGNEELFLFNLSSNELADLCTYDSRSATNPDGIQRSLDNRRVKQIAGFVNEESNLLPSGIVVNLGTEVEVLEDSDELNTVKLLFPDSHGDFMTVIDGQHRLKGLKTNEEVDYGLPVVAFKNISREQAAKVFADLNYNQKKVSNVHLLELRNIVDSLKPMEKRALEIVHALNNDQDSPIKGKIQIRDDQKDCWISNVRLKELLTPHLRGSGNLVAKSKDESTVILKNYLNAVKDTWIDIWEGDNQSYIITWSIGFEILFGFFAQIMKFCDLYEDRSYSTEAFKHQLRNLVDLELEIKDKGKIKLNWEKETSRKFNSTSGRKDLIDQLNLKLAQIDEERLSANSTEAGESDDSPSPEEEESSGPDELQ